MKLQVWIQEYEFESIQFCPPLLLKHKSGKSKANRLKKVKACVQSLLTMHTSEDMPAAESWRYWLLLVTPVFPSYCAVL